MDEDWFCILDNLSQVVQAFNDLDACVSAEQSHQPEEPQQPQQNHQQYGDQQGGSRTPVVLHDDGAVPSTSRSLTLPPSDRQQNPDQEGGNRVPVVLHDDGAVPSTSRAQTLSSSVRLHQHPSQHVGFKVLHDSKTTNSKFKTARQNVTIILDNIPSGRDPEEWIGETFTNIIEMITSGSGPCKDNDKVGLKIYSEASPEQPISISFRNVDQLNAEIILQAISCVTQSNADFLIKGPLSITLTHIDMPNGSARNAIPAFVPDKVFASKKGSIISIDNTLEDDRLCHARALVVGIALHEATPQEMDSLRHTKKIQGKRASEYCTAAGVDLSNGGGMDEVRQFQDHFDKYQITVFGDRSGKNVLFEGPSGTLTEPRKNIDLFYYDNHFDVITSVTGAFDCSFYCRPCHIGFSNMGGHKCPSVCTRCYNKEMCPENTRRIKCNNCLMTFKGQQCYINHLLPRYDKKRSVCEVHRICSKCDKYFNLRDRKSHKCGEVMCQICKKFCDANHQCFMRKIEPKKRKKDSNLVYFFYDIEATQCTPVPDKTDVFEHDPNLLVSQQCCLKCINLPVTEPCAACAPGETRQKIFYAPDPVGKFMKHIRKHRTGVQEVLALAHNMKGYDGHFILRNMVTELNWSPEILATGAKLLSLSCKDITFKDSLNYLPMPLSSLPKALNLSAETKKGYFPHFFNKPCNYDYVGEVPPPEAYGADEMMVKDREKFMIWHAEQTEQKSIFDFQKELVDYCIKYDVNVLRSACVSFRNDFLIENKLDPFWEAVTIAGACMKVFQQNYLKERTIGIIPTGGYRCADMQSHIATTWIKWEQHKNNIKIKHAESGREQILLGRFKVDGYHEKENGEKENGEKKIIKTVYEYHGCYFHGCIRCYPDQSLKVGGVDSHETMGHRYETTQHKTAILQAAEYEVVEMWGCDYEALKKKDAALNEFLCRPNHSFIKQKPQVPRDAFHGGRTNCVKTHYKVRPGEKIFYYDVCSLYPYINKYGIYVLGHPSIHFGEDCQMLVGPTNDISKLNGLIKCTLLPPQQLYHPVLPMKMGGKLLFALCHECAVNLEQTECPHTDISDRQFTGTWVIAEVQKAVQMGYVILEVHEVWDYQTTQYNPITMSGGFFVEYINNFLKMKVEASGWPENCKSEQEKAQYIKNFEKREGIKLDSAKIAHNPGHRGLAKLMLNSFWGKFGQRDDFVQHKFVETYSELVLLVSNPSNEVLTCDTLSDDKILCSWKPCNEGIQASPRTNVVIASITTALARLKLYTYLEQLGERVLYFDTDSVIFVTRAGDQNPPTGDFLGDMTDELTEYCPGSYISEFNSAGPKNYSYKVVCNGNIETQKTVCKVRGLRLNYAASSIVNFESMKDAILRDVEEDTAPLLITIPHKIARVKHFKIVSREEKKVYQPVITKRRLTDERDTLPYGFKRQRM